MAETRSAGGKRQRRSAEEWREIFERRAASGLPIAAFCQREGIAHSIYARWRTLLVNATRDAGVALSRTGTAGHRGARTGLHRQPLRGRRTHPRTETGRHEETRLPIDACQAARREVLCLGQSAIRSPGAAAQQSDDQGTGLCSRTTFRAGSLS